MAKIWVNPAFKKKEKEENKKENKKTDKTSLSSILSGPQRLSRKFLQKLIDNKTQTTIVFYDGTSIAGKLKWFDNHSICFEESGIEMIFDTKNIVYYRS